MDFYEMEMKEKKDALGAGAAPPSVADEFGTTVAYDRRTETKPLISFLVPVFNERPLIKAALDKLAAVPLAKEIIVVDDGSTDGTRGALTENPRNGTVLLLHNKNQGKGGALRTALTKAMGSYAAVQDADLEYDPNDYVELLKFARQNNAKVVFGSRFLKPNPRIYWRFLLGNKLLTTWINLLCASSYTDCYTGAKLMSTAVWRGLGLISNGFEIEAEIAVKIARGGYSFTEYPITYKPRKVAEGKKISWNDAVQGFKAAHRFASKK
ncbi:MAG: glycosyltransferase family 2 protein [Elusimicrobia bacterium]|nr:glycosyltransferase family 2 protein [Elusimicrobiota bacterium]